MKRLEMWVYSDISEDREEKVKRIFNHFDLNGDGSLNVSEIAALFVSVNQRELEFNNDYQITDINNEINLNYGSFFNGEKGLSLEGLRRSYEDRVEDLDRDFEALGLSLSNTPTANTGPLAFEASASSSISIVEIKYRIASRPAFLKEGIAFDGTWDIVIALENRVDEFLGKMKMGEAVHAHNDYGCLIELEPFFPGRPIVLNESDCDHALFAKYLGFLRYAVDGRQKKRSKEEALDAHMGMGRLLYFHKLFEEALVSFRRSSDLEKTDAPSRLWVGNCLCFLGRYKEAKDEYLWALEIAEVDHEKWDYLLPQIHLNLGIVSEKRGEASEASKHYGKAVALCPQNVKKLWLLASALIQAEDYIAAEKALEEASSLEANNAEAHYNLGRVFHATGRNERAIQEYRRAVKLKPGHVNAMYHLGMLFMEMERYRMASAMFDQVIDANPNNWRAKLNRNVALSRIAGEDEDTKALNEAFEMWDKSGESREMMVAHINQLQKKAHGGSDERIKDVVAEIRRSYIKFMKGQCGGIIANYFSGAKDDASVVTIAPLMNPERALSKILQTTETKERALEEHRKAMALRPCHVNAAYNLGVLYMEMGRCRMASAMYAKVLDVWPSNWHASLNRAVVSAWLAKDREAARKPVKEAFEMMSNKVESEDLAISHIKQLQKKAHRGSDKRTKAVLNEVLESYVKFKKRKKLVS
ncbi:hypothetical protein Syun_005284 [Stephania yunnanensis]|uniref:EF-hand domain-containing protein n=1 Tax=Stephania yunnanensis TaxID=152371 RepID=A0AAP0L4F7_9MAGN